MNWLKAIPTPIFLPMTKMPNLLRSAWREYFAARCFGHGQNRLHQNSQNHEQKSIRSKFARTGKNSNLFREAKSRGRSEVSFGGMTRQGDIQGSTLLYHQLYVATQLYGYCWSNVHCTVLFCAVLHYSALHCTALHCTLCLACTSFQKLKRDPAIITTALGNTPPPPPPPTYFSFFLFLPPPLPFPTPPSPLPPTPPS